jgi:hypothetical protein
MIVTIIYDDNNINMIDEKNRDKQTLRFAISKLNSSSVHVGMKATGVYLHMTLDHERRPFLIETKSMDILVKLLDHKIQPIKREAANCLYNILRAP